MSNVDIIAISGREKGGAGDLFGLLLQPKNDRNMTQIKCIQQAPAYLCTRPMNIDSFYIAGINYKKTDVSIRGSFAVNSTQYQSILAKAAQQNIPGVFVLSTCNRTEIYGMVHDVEQLIQLLCSETTGSETTFRQLAYIKQGENAVNHLFDVGAGLDSQILGDYEIIGQIKQSVKLAKERGLINTLLERLLNTVLQSGKAIRSQTQLSSGTVSVSFAAIRFLKDTVTAIQHKKILLLGTGKIGSNTCRNLVDYLGAKDIKLINRTEDKACELAKELDLRIASYTDLQGEITKADIVIVAANASTPLIQKQHLDGRTPKILIDLSIPNNIDPSVQELPGITLTDVDGLSLINDATLQKRIAEVPKAKSIIEAHRNEFMEWCLHRRSVPVMNAVKQKLTSIHTCGLYNSTINSTHTDAHTIQKVISGMAVKMRSNHQPGCNYIEAISDFITSGAN